MALRKIWYELRKLIKTDADDSRYHGQIAYDITRDILLVSSSLLFFYGSKSRWDHTCADEETTLHCDVLGHKRCDIVSGTKMAILSAKLIETIYGKPG